MFKKTFLTTLSGRKSKSKKILRIDLQNETRYDILVLQG